MIINDTTTPIAERKYTVEMTGEELQRLFILSFRHEHADGDLGCCAAVDGFRDYRLLHSVPNEIRKSAFARFGNER